MKKFLLMNKRCLDIILTKGDARALVKTMKCLSAEKLGSAQQVQMIRWGSIDPPEFTNFILGKSVDDYISLVKDQITITFSQETLEYAVDKLEKFVDSGRMFPAELQSFEIVGMRRSIMVYLYSGASYGTA